MTGEEKRKKMKEELKEQYKRDLKLRKEFLDKAKTLRHTQKLNEAVSGIISGLTEDDSDDWINQLNEESALSEAKMEVAFDDQNTATEEIKKMAQEAENKKFSAEEMVRKMKREMGLIPPEEEKPAAEVQEEVVATEETTSDDSPADEPEPKEESKQQEDIPPPPRKRLGDF